MKTRSSRCISSRMASRSASRYVMVRILIYTPLMRVNARSTAVVRLAPVVRWFTHALVYLFPLITKAERGRIIDHYVGIEFFQRRIRTVLSKFGRFLGYLGSFSIVLVKFSLGCQVKFEQPPLKHTDRV